MTKKREQHAQQEAAAEAPQPVVAAESDLQSAVGPTLPIFTNDELRVIHHELHHLPWQKEYGYLERRSIASKLAAYFGVDVAHLAHKLK